MNVLWLGAYWYGWDLLYRSLKSLDEHEITLIRYDPPRAGDKRIPELIQPIVTEKNFDVIIYVGVNGGSCLPMADELIQLKSLAPTVLLCPEASDDQWWRGHVKKYYEDKSFDLIVNVDGNSNWPYSEYGITRLPPIDITPWKTPKSWEERKYLCGFWGNQGGGGIRGEILNILGDTINVHTNMPARPEYEEEDNLNSYDLYIDFLRNCKSVFNEAGRADSKTIGDIMIEYGLGSTIDVIHKSLQEGGRTHVKVRIVEIGLAGATLIEQASSETKRWFIPGEDYLTYTTVDEIRQKISWIESHPDDAQKIANNLHNRVINEHSPKVFWNDIFDKLFSGV